MNLISVVPALTVGRPWEANKGVGCVERKTSNINYSSAWRAFYKHKKKIVSTVYCNCSRQIMLVELTYQHSGRCL